MFLFVSQDIYEDTKNQYMTIDDVLLERSIDGNTTSSVTPGVLDLSDSSGVSSEHDSTESSVTTATMTAGTGGSGHRFTRSQYRVLQVGGT